MKRLFIYVVMAMTIASCTNDISAPGQDTDMTSDAGLSKASYLVGGGDQSRVRNYAYSAPAATRAGEGMQMPAYPTIPTTATEQTDTNGNGTGVFKITKYFNGTLNMSSGSTLYVGENVECDINSINTGGLTVYIMEGATVNFKSNQIPNSVKIYNWGTFNTSGNFEIQNNCAFYSNKDVEINGTLNLNGCSYYCKGTTIAKKIYVKTNTTVESCTFVVGSESLPNYGGTPQQWNFQTSDNGVIEFENGNNVVFKASWIQAGCINFNANEGMDFVLGDNGRIDTKYLVIDPVKTNQMIKTSGSNAVVCAPYIHLVESIQNNPDKLLPNFGVGVHLQKVETIHENGQNYSPSLYTIPTDGGINDENFSMGKGECSPGYGDPGTPTGPTLDLVTDVESQTHNHDSDKPEKRRLSATSLTFDKDKGEIYVSYHMRGYNWAEDQYDKGKDDVEGCIERWTFENGQIAIGNWMWTNDFDFNHILLDGEYVITVGHKGGEKVYTDDDGKEQTKRTDYGGIIGRMPTEVWKQNWDATDELTREDFVYKYLTTNEELRKDYENPKKGTTTNQLVDYKSAGDGNCVIRVGNEYFVATSMGYGRVNAADFKRVKDADGKVLFHITPGSAKYLVQSGDEINVLYLNDRFDPSKEDSKSKATVATMSVDAFPTAGTTKDMKQVVTPVDGKNVLAVDDDGTVYACLSLNGLQIGDSDPIMFGNERAVNGVAVDDEYIYVANGNYITVLDKATRKQITERRGGEVDDKISANFVEVKKIGDDRYVFVAFGQNGIKVYKFNPAK